MTKLASVASDGTRSETLPRGAIPPDALEAVRELIDLASRWGKKLRPHYELEQEQRERITALYASCKANLDKEWVSESLEDNFEATFGGLWRDESRPLRAELDKDGTLDHVEFAIGRLPDARELLKRAPSAELRRVLRAVAGAIAWGREVGVESYDPWFWTLAAIAGDVLPLVDDQVEAALDAARRAGAHETTTEPNSAAERVPEVAKIATSAALEADARAVVRRLVKNGVKLTIVEARGAFHLNPREAACLRQRLKGRADLATNREDGGYVGHPQYPADELRRMVESIRENAK